MRSAASVSSPGSRYRASRGSPTTTLRAADLDASLRISPTACSQRRKPPVAHLYARVVAGNVSDISLAPARPPRCFRPPAPRPPGRAHRVRCHAWHLRSAPAARQAPHELPSSSATAPSASCSAEVSDRRSVPATRRSAIRVLPHAGRVCGGSGCCTGAATRRPDLPNVLHEVTIDVVGTIGLHDRGAKRRMNWSNACVHVALLAA